MLFLAEQDIWIVVYGSIALPLYTNGTELSTITTLVDRTSLSACGLERPEFSSGVEEEVSWSVGLCVGALQAVFKVVASCMLCIRSYSTEIIESPRS